MRRTTQLSLVFAALIGGVALGRTGIESSAVIAISALVLAVLSFRSRLFVTCLMLAAITFGVWRTTVWTADRQELASLIGREVNLTAIVVDDPSQNDKGHVSLTLGHLRIDGQTPVPGQLKVYTYPVRLQRGYEVQATGVVKPGFGNAVAELSFPNIQTLSTHQNWLERFRQQFFAGMRTALPEPLASFGLGLLVGIRALIPKDMQAELTLVGLSHLVAVSGYNLTIIVAAVDRTLQRAGRGVALATSLWLIAGFLVVTGASASIVRASIVSVLSLVAGFYGLRFNPLTLIFITGGITAAADPKYLTDLGWLLSFLAFFGILVVAPAIEARLRHPKSVVIRLFIESSTAHLLTLPLILFMFSQLSIVAPLTNLLVLPLIPLAMATSFLAGIAGMIMPAFAGWLSWPALAVLGFIQAIIDQFASLPWAGRTERLSLMAMLAMYALIIVFTIACKRANQRAGRRENATDRLLEPTKTS